jgi:hypothetical protein
MTTGDGSRGEAGGSGGSVLASARSWGALAWGKAADRVRRGWDNPLLRHARRLKPMPLRRTRIGLLIAAGSLLLLDVLAWIEGWRFWGALLIGLGLGAVVAPAVVAPVVGADRVARQMRYNRRDPRRLTDLTPLEVAWGLALVTLWDLRWLIAAALALTPVLILGVLRLDVSRFAALRDSVQALGAATPAGRAGELLPGGRIPYVRLVMHALSAGLLPWAALPLLAVLGVTAALCLKDLTLSPLAALLGEVALGIVVGLVWGFIARTPLLAGALEIARLALLVGLLAGLGVLADRVNRYNAGLLVAARRG